MQDSMKNWIEFFRNKAISDIDIPALERIHSLLSNYYTKSYVLPNVIFNILNGNFTYFCNVIKALTEANIISYSPNCPNCGDPLDFLNAKSNISECEKCGTDFEYTDIEDSILILIDGRGISVLNEASYELNALILSKQALQRGTIFYLLCDIEGSETLQKSSSILYNSYIRQLWSNYFPSSLRNCNKAYLPLMAKGDASIIAFLDIQDAFQFIKVLSKQINGKEFKLTIYLDKIDYTPEDFSGFVRTLDNKWDFNSENVTLFHRRAHSIKPTSWKNVSNYSIKVCLLDNLTSSKRNIERNLKYSYAEEGYSFESKHNEKFTGKIISYAI
ncbi:hypothetical protein LFX25_19960 [Leptospira sp. FAT2]|uniref:hypothetical protein n=1 Tax=Leptospira sanjuanensis TaxID=2879643 RepID=UPI001EE840D7|nr:hypothetical protein [Leptospira sanjuanensis]MCG6195520.1 hypothetical protein [Leptospira sanjuanensis]